MREPRASRSARERGGRALIPDGSLGLRAGFALLSVALGAGLAFAVVDAARASGEPRERARRAGLGTAGLTALWLGFSGRLAATGFLSFEPPTLPPLLVLALLGTIGLAFSRFGTRLAFGLPLPLLVGFQAFRVPVEILLARGHAEGLVPVQLTWSGLNFDVLSGVLAALLALLARLGPVPRWLLFAWSFVGLGLLVNVVAIAALSAPTPLRVFLAEPANVFVARFPFVWLPGFLVPMALFGHLLVLRRLFAAQGGGGGAATVAGGVAGR